MKEASSQPKPAFKSNTSINNGLQTYDLSREEEIKKPTTLTELSNNGWTILKRNNKKNTILRPYNEQFLKRKNRKKTNNISIK